MRARGAIFLVLLLFLVAGCSDGVSAKSGSRAGVDLYATQGCVTCHAPDGSGTVFGPTLLGKKSFWTREKLVVYLREPQAYTAKDPRLSEQARRFTLPMQRFDKLTPEELAAIAEHVLSLP